MMKNLFDYATKELSQDAFLRWLFENYDDAEVGKAARKLLTLFCKLSHDEIIKELHTIAQWHKVDVSVWITTSKRKIALFIEDKTFSNEHNQLSVYNQYIDSIADYTHIYKVFYKTMRMEQWEYQRISEVNAVSNIPWCSYDIRDICFQFGEFANSSNIILAQYVQHFNTIYSLLCNTHRPLHNDNQIDLLKWQSYFENVVRDYLDNIFGEDIIIWTRQGGQYSYASLGIKANGYSKQIPYLEIRSRDCTDNTFEAKFLCYGMPNEDVRQQQFLIECIQQEGSFKCKHLRYRKSGQDIFPKQIGTTERIAVASDEAFVDLIIRYVKTYLALMQDWK